MDPWLELGLGMFRMRSYAKGKGWLGVLWSLYWAFILFLLLLLSFVLDIDKRRGLGKQKVSIQKFRFLYTVLLSNKHLSCTLYIVYIQALP